ASSPESPRPTTSKSIPLTAPSSEVSRRATKVADGEEAPTPAVEEEPMASTFTVALLATALRTPTSARRNRSPLLCLALQSGESPGGVAGSATAGAERCAGICSTAAIGAQANAPPRAQGSNRSYIESAAPLSLPPF